MAAAAAALEAAAEQEGWRPEGLARGRGAGGATEAVTAPCTRHSPPEGGRRPAPSARPLPRPRVRPRSAGGRLSASSLPRAEGPRPARRTATSARARGPRRARLAASAAAAAASTSGAARPGLWRSAGRAGATRSARSARTPRPRRDPGGRRARAEGAEGRAEGRAEGAAAAHTRSGAEPPPLARTRPGWAWEPGPGALPPPLCGLRPGRSRDAEAGALPPPAAACAGTPRGRPARTEGRGRPALRGGRCLHLLGRARPRQLRGAGARNMAAICLGPTRCVLGAPQPTLQGGSRSPGLA